MNNCKVYSTGLSANNTAFCLVIYDAEYKSEIHKHGVLIGICEGQRVMYDCVANIVDVPEEISHFVDSGEDMSCGFLKNHMDIEITDRCEKYLSKFSDFSMRYQVEEKLKLKEVSINEYVYDMMTNVLHKTKEINIKPYEFTEVMNDELRDMLRLIQSQVLKYLPSK